MVGKASFPTTATSRTRGVRMLSGGHVGGALRALTAARDNRPATGTTHSPQGVPDTQKRRQRDEYLECQDESTQRIGGSRNGSNLPLGGEIEPRFRHRLVLARRGDVRHSAVCGEEPYGRHGSQKPHDRAQLAENHELLERAFSFSPRHRMTFRLTSSHQGPCRGDTESRASSACLVSPAWLARMFARHSFHVGYLSPPRTQTGLDHAIWPSFWVTRRR